MESFRKFSIIDEQLRIAKAFGDNHAYGKYLMTHLLYGFALRSMDVLIE